MPHATIVIRPDVALADALVASHPSVHNLTNAVFAELGGVGEDTVDIRIGRGRDANVTLGTETLATGAGHDVTLAAGNAVGAGPSVGGGVVLQPGAGVGGGAAGRVRALADVHLEGAGLNVGGSVNPASGDGIFTRGLVVGGDLAPGTARIDVFHATTVPSLHFDFDDATPAVDDVIGQIFFKGENSTGGDVTYADIDARLQVVSAGSEVGRLHFWVAKSGTLTEMLRVVGDNGVIVNEGGDPLGNFRVESDTKPYHLYCEANGSMENIALLAPSAPGWGGMDGGLFVANATTAPTSNPTGGGFLYVSSGALTFRGSSGTITTIAAAEPHCPRCGMDYVLEWRNAGYARSHLAVCLPCLLGELQRLGADPARCTFARAG